LPERLSQVLHQVLQNNVMPHPHDLSLQAFIFHLLGELEHWQIISVLKDYNNRYKNQSRTILFGYSIVYQQHDSL